LAYLVAAWNSLRRTPTEFSITVDSRWFRRRAQTVMIANVGKIVGGIELVPGADPNDGALEVAIVRTRGLRELALLALETALGRNRNNPLLEIHHGRQILIETPRPQPVQLDGNEAGAASRLEVHVEPGALQIVGPADPQSASPEPFLASIRMPVTPFGRGLALSTALAAIILPAVYLRTRASRRRGLKSGLNEPVVTGSDRDTLGLAGQDSPEERVADEFRL
jgi:hypothetical protein